MHGNWVSIRQDSLQIAEVPVVTASGLWGYGSQSEAKQSQVFNIVLTHKQHFGILGAA